MEKVPSPQLTPQALSTLRVMTEGGIQRIPSSSREGALHRPLASSSEQAGGRVSALETLYDYFMDVVPDPDFALTRDIGFLERMRQQPDVHAAMRKREVTVASLPTIWKPSTEKGVDPGEAQLMADYVSDVWRNLPNNPELYRMMEGAVLKGGEGFEFMWTADATGVLRPTSWVNVNKTRFVFDRLGNMALLTRETPVWGSYVAPSPENAPEVFGKYRAFPIPLGKFMYHKYMAEGGTWQFPAGEGYQYWGRGEDTNLYYIIKFDQWVLRFRLKWLEKHGMPFTILYYPEGVVSQSDVDAVVKSIRDEAVATLAHPAGMPIDSWFQIEFVQPPAMGYDAFANFQREWTAPAVDKILLGGADLMSLGDVGGFSATMSQRDAGEAMLFRYDALLIDETINHQIVPYIIRAVPRWANVPMGHMPQHVKAPERERNRILDLEVIERAARMVPIKEDDVYDAAGKQRPKDGADGSTPERTIFMGQPPAGGDIWSALPDDQKASLRNPDQRGLSSVESPRMEQTLEGRVGKMNRVQKIMQQQIAVANSRMAAPGGKLQKLQKQGRGK